MFGLTKRQFLRRTKTTLNETGKAALLIRGILDDERNGDVDDEMYRTINQIQDDVNGIFFSYESLNPPTKCVVIQLKILHNLITLQEAVAANYEYIIPLNDIDVGNNHDKLEASEILLDKFRKEFRTLIREMDKILMINGIVKISNNLQ